MSEADDRYVAEIARDCERILGTGVELVDVTRHDGATGVRLVAHYRLTDDLLETAPTARLSSRRTRRCASASSSTGCATPSPP